MRKYVYLQLKRALRLLPFVLLITALLFTALAVAFTQVIGLRNEGDAVKRLQIGFTGDIDQKYLSMGIAALQTFDDSRFALELEVLEEEDARRALEKRELAAYFVFPEGFTEAALYGDFKTIRLVTRAGAGGLELMFKDELTKTVTDLLVASQKGVYGTEFALDANGYADISLEYLNKMNYSYIEFIFNRSEIYQTEVLGIADSLSLPEYFFCSFAVFGLLLTGLPYATVFIKKDWGLSRILAAKGLSAGKQVICEYTAYGVSLLLTAGLLLLALGSDTLFWHTLPVVAMTAAFTLLLFEISGNLISGLLLQFFASLCLCYASGCFYPIYTFPKTLQLIAPFLPTGMARSCLAAGITGGGAGVLGCLLYGVGFLALTVAVRRRKIAGKVTVW